MIVNHEDEEYEEPPSVRAPVWLNESDNDLRGINNGHHASTPPPPLGHEGNGTAYAAPPGAPNNGSSSLGSVTGGGSVHNPELAGFLSQAEPPSDEESGNGSGISGDDGNGFDNGNGHGGGWGAAWQSFRSYSGLGGESSKSSADGGARYVQLSEQAAELRSRASAAAAGAYEQIREAEVPTSVQATASEVQLLLQNCDATWKHLLALYLLGFLTFTIACAALSRANSALSSSSGSKSGNSGGGGSSNGGTFCARSADVLWGDPILQSDDGKTAYQVVGNGASSQFSWKSASLDAGTRCYQGRQGFLAHVDSATSQNTVHRALYALTPSLEASSSSSSSSISSSSSAGAWVGALELASSADSSKEAPPSFSWVLFRYGQPVSGTGTGGTTEPFWTGDGATGSAVKGAFINWGPNQPITSVESEAAGNGAKGCVSMSKDSGFWQTEACSSALPYFIVQF